MSQTREITKVEQIVFVIILILSHVVVVVSVFLVPVPIMRVLIVLSDWLDS